MLAEPDGGSFAGISAAVGGIVEAADAGFSISESGGQPLLNAIHDLQVEVANALRNATFLEQELPLGATPNANIYKPFIATVASDPSQGAITVLKKLHDDLASASAAIQKSISNSFQTDENAATNIGSSGTWT